MSGSSTSKSKKPVKNGETGSAKQECPVFECKLVELVEVVTQDKEKWVKGAGADCTDTGVITEKVVPDRTEKDGAAYKQYINLEKDLETQAKRHPEYGRYIELRARIKWKDGDRNTQKISLAGKKVNFKATETKHTNRPGVFKVEKEKPGFDSTNGILAKSAVLTRADGWTNPPVKFYLSQYGGDKYKFSAQVDEDGKGKMGAKKETKEYVVWKKFWYQYSVPTGFALPNLAKSLEAYKKVATEMAASKIEKIEYTKDDLNAIEADIADRTIYKKNRCVKNNNEADDKLVYAIGSHNKETVFKFFNSKDAGDGTSKDDLKKMEPVKVHLMLCGFQWDPEGETKTITEPFAKNISEKIITGNGIIISPALEGRLVTSFKYRVKKTDGNFDAAQELDLPDANIEIPKNRNSLDKFKLTLPVAIVNAGKAAGKDGVEVVMRLGKAASYLGESAGPQILCVHGADSNDKGTNNTIIHEIGHSFSQVRQKKIADYHKDDNNYEKDDFIEYKSGLYRCIKGNKGKNPSGPKWQAVSYSGEWNATKTYKKYQVPERPAGTYWISLKDNNTNHAPAAGEWWVAESDQGAWDKDTTYSKNKTVKSNGGYWFSIADANTGNKPPGGEYWVACPNKGAWSNATDYIKDDLVKHADFDWVSKDSHTNHEPPHASWQKVFYSKVKKADGKNYKMRQSNPPPSPTLGLHSKQYSNERGGQGSHCATGASDETHATWPAGVVAGAHLWYEGTCVMFHSGPSNDPVDRVYCDECKPYLRLQDMSKLK